MKGQIWHLDLQQGTLLLSEDGSHLILALNDLCFDARPPVIGGLSLRYL